MNIGIDILKMLEMLKNVLASIFVKLWRYFRVRVKNFHITVASEDAATTAMLYGAVCGYGDAIFKILGKALDFKVEKGARVGADCDYLSDEMKMDIEIDISITVGQVLRYIFGIIGAAVGGALRGLKLSLNKNFFAHKKKYKADLAEYNAARAETENKTSDDIAQNAESSDDTSDETEKNNSEINSEINKEDSETETSERENNNVSEE